MKNRKLKSIKQVLFFGVLYMTMIGCERGLSDDVIIATFPATPEVFTDAPVGLTDAFFISFDPADGANVNGFGTDDAVAFEGTTSIRIDVPSPSDPDGGFIGGIFLDRGDGRNLTGYDALTFWARGSTTATVGLVGFGTDFIANEHAVGLENIILSTDWKQYTIPIPDASKLIQEKGMFIFAAGTDSTNGLGYTFWLDEIRFERLGNVAQARPSIMNGVDESQQSFINSIINISGISTTFNLGDGSDVTVNVAPSYLSFQTSDPTVAQVNDLGEVTVVGSGTAVITATLDGVDAIGSLTIESLGEFNLAPTPTIPQANVLSIFSDAYTNAAESNFTPGFGGSTTQTTISSANGNQFATYTSNNFTGILFDDNPIDASGMSFMHVDILVQDAGTTSVEFQIRDIGANQTLETDIFTGFPNGDDVDLRFTATGFTIGEWVSFDIPLNGSLAGQRSNLGAIILAGGPNFTLDNIFFYTN